MRKCLNTYSFKKTLLGFFLFLNFAELFANDVDSTTSKFNAFKVFPLVYFTTETKVIAELFTYLSFKMDKHSNLSNIRLSANYTQEKQYSVLCPFQILLGKNNYFINGKLEFIHFPEYFYGLGNNTLESNRSKYLFDTFLLQIKALKLVKRKNYLGINLSRQALKTAYDESLELFKEANNIPGIDGYSYFSIGPSYLYDSRDDLITSRKGVYFEVNFTWAKGIKTNQGPLNYTNFNIDFRKFIDFKTKGVLAFQGLTDLSFGHIPYRAMPTLGGQKLLRGYYFGRFRDKQLLLSNLEYRSPLYRRIGLAAFMGAGKVGPNLKELASNLFHLSFGAGLRYQISKKDRATIRADFAKGRDSYGIYLFFAEAF